MNTLYRDAATDVSSDFTFNDEVLKAFLKHIYSKDFHPMDEIEEGMFNAVWEKLNIATDKGFGTRQDHDPDYDFYQELRYNNAVFSAFKVHRMQNDMAAFLLDSNGNLKPFEQWAKEVMPIADHQVYQWLRTEYDTAIIRAHQAADWKQFEREIDILPNLEWIESTSVTPGEDHRRFWGIVRPVNDTFWDNHRPGDRWNCKCGLRNTGKRATPKNKLPDGGKKDNPSDGLDGNPGKTGSIFGKTHPYIKNAYDGAKKAVRKLMGKVEEEEFSKKMPKALLPEQDYLKGKKIRFKKDFFNLIDDTPGKDIRFQIDINGSGSYYMPDTTKVREGRKIVDVPEPKRRMVHIAENKRNKASDWHRESVIYHEFGHAIDAQRNMYASKELKDVMDKGRMELGRRGKYSYWDIRYSSEKQAFAPVKVEKTMSRFEYVDKRLGQLYEKVRRMDAETFKRRGISQEDVIEQICSTMDTIMSLNSRFGFGHSKEYFKITGMSEKEFIAHCFENTFAGNRVFKKYLPELYDDMVKYIERLTP